MPLRRDDGVALARALKQKAQEERLPVRAVYLFGSVARDEAHAWSDVDIAVICDPFLPTRHEEDMVLRRLRRDIDVRISPISLHPEDLRNKYFGLAQEVRRNGISL